jgi:hypothetical protein
MDSGAPQSISDLANACRTYVRAAFGAELDYSAETLPLVDHYIERVRRDVADRPDLRELTARTIGAYFGEVARAQIDGFWRLGSPNIHDWAVCARPVFLWFNPFGAAWDALSGGEEHAGPRSTIHVAPEYRAAVDARLSSAPPVPELEYYLLSTRVEALEIVVETLRIEMERAGYGEVDYDESDYGAELRPL